MPTYYISLVMTGLVTVEVELEAPTRAEAEEEAMRLVDEDKVGWTKDEFHCEKVEILSVEEG